MSALLEAALVPVVLYCLARALVPGRFGPVHHRRDVDVWHVLLGLAMLAMLVGGLPAAVAWAVRALAVVALVWGVLSVERELGGASYVRLAVGGAAMALMSLPLATPAQASPARPMPGMPAVSHGAGWSWSPVAGVLLAALLVAGVTAAATVTHRPAGVVRRLDAACDVVMAGVMAALLAGLG